jgi:1-deoxy-D-xylulose-5-phosphate reductoisomerase
MVKNIVIFGATGSIGRSVLNVVAKHGDHFGIAGIAAWRNIDGLAEIARKFGVKNVAIGDRSMLPRRELFATGTTFFSGESGLRELAELEEADSIVMAISGTAGMAATVAAIKCGKTIMLASKEILAVAGKFIVPLASDHAAQLLPIDSEHNAIFQCLRGNGAASVDRLILTASGGPFHGLSAEKLEGVTVERALRHPTWKMGKKITIDSATMVNKGLEIIEARWLFSVPGSRIDVLIHPESVMHSMVKFCDGSILGQMCPPNMEFPIANCMFFPERRVNFAPTVDFEKLGALTFLRCDEGRFPNLSIARQCLECECNACAVFNGADEVAVGEFLSGKIKFTQIDAIIAETLDAYSGERMTSIESCIESAAKAHSIAKKIASKFH